MNKSKIVGASLGSFKDLTLEVTKKEFYLFNLKLSIKTILRGHLIAGLKRLVSVNYWRYLENPLTINNLKLTPNCRILDIGSPKTPFFFLVDKKKYIIYATDIQDRLFYLELFLSVMKAGIEVSQNKAVVEIQDGRKLTYPDNFFDRVYSISVVEHIPDDGDTKTLQEICRVLKDGGVAVITVPFCNEYYEEFRHGNVFERKYINEPTLWQRHYNNEALRKRLVEPSGLKLTKIEYFGEKGFKFERKINKLPVFLRAPLSILSPIFSNCFISEIRTEIDDLGEAMTVCLTLTKHTNELHLSENKEVRKNGNECEKES